MSEKKCKKFFALGKRKPPLPQWFQFQDKKMAPGLGLEPRLEDPESPVLPLHHPGVNTLALSKSTFIVYGGTLENARTFLFSFSDFHPCRNVGILSFYIMIPAKTPGYFSVESRPLPEAAYPRSARSLDNCLGSA